VHHVLVMTVNPGFGGQSFIHNRKQSTPIAQSESNRTELPHRSGWRRLRIPCTSSKQALSFLLQDRRSLNRERPNERKALSETGACSCQSLTVGLHYGEHESELSKLVDQLNRSATSAKSSEKRSLDQILTVDSKPRLNIILVAVRQLR